MLTKIVNQPIMSRDDQEVGVAHEVKSPKKTASIFLDNNGAVLVR